MPFKYSCFVSYRHARRELAERILNGLCEALSNELELYIDQDIYVDRERLRGGDFYNENLATALCESICMIMIFTPTYFDKDHAFCAREYKAMERIEEDRLRALGALSDKKHGFIIPIVFRGEDCLPREIKQRRHYYKFDDFLLSDPEIAKHPKYAAVIKDIAKRIYDLHKALKALTEDPCSGCDSFTLPTETEIADWLEEVHGTTTPFPGRAGA